MADRRRQFRCVFLWQMVGMAIGESIGMAGFHADGWPWWIPMLCATAGSAVPVVVTWRSQ